MAGLINATPTADQLAAQQKAEADKALAAKTTSSIAPTVAQTKWTVDSPQTVQGQIADITAKDAPLQQLAKTSAIQQAARSGLINTSMAVGAAQDAVTRSALPIAQQDAQTFAAAGQTNTAESNKIGMFNSELATKNDQFNVGIEMQKLDMASREKLAANDIEFKKFASASDAGKQFFDTYQKSINSILLNPDLSTTPGTDGISPKQKALDMAAQTFQAGMTMHQDITGLNLENILTFDAGSANSGSTINSAVGNTDSAKDIALQEQKIADLQAQIETIANSKQKTSYRNRYD